VELREKGGVTLIKVVSIGSKLLIDCLRKTGPPQSIPALQPISKRCKPVRQGEDFACGDDSAIHTHSSSAALCHQLLEWGATFLAELCMSRDFAGLAKGNLRSVFGNHQKTVHTELTQALPDVGQTSQGWLPAGVDSWAELGTLLGKIYKTGETSVTSLASYRLLS
jgi:hypothetical protein